MIDRGEFKLILIIWRKESIKNWERNILGRCNFKDKTGKSSKKINKGHLVSKKRSSKAEA